MRPAPLAVLLVLVGALMLRAAGIGDHAYWLDEWYSLSEARGLDPALVPISTDFTQEQLLARTGWSEMRSSLLANDGGNGSLYIVLLRVWTNLFGTGPGALRGLSVLFGLCVVILVHALARQLFKASHLATVAATVVSVSPFLVLYSSEARGYMLATALGLLSTLLFVRSFLSGHRPTMGQAAFYCVASTAMLFSHYSALYILFGHAVVASLYVRDRRAWSILIFSGAIAAASILLWMSTEDWAGPRAMATRNAGYQSQLGNSTWFEATNPRSAITGLISQFTWIIGTAPQLMGIQLRWSLLATVVPVLCLLPVLRGLRNGTHARALILLAALALAALPYSAVLALVSGHTIAFQPLYAIFSAPYIALLLAFGIRALWISGSPIRRSTVIAFGLLTMGGIAGSFRDLRQVGPYTTELESVLIGTTARHAALHDMHLVYCTPELAIEMNLLLPPSAAQLPQRVEVGLPADIVLRIGGERTGRTVIIREKRNGL